MGGEGCVCTVGVLFEVGHSRDEVVAGSHVTDLIDAAELKATAVLFEQAVPIERLIELIAEFVVA